MTDIDRVRDLIISLSRSWHPSREHVQRIVDAVRGVEVEMQSPDASVVTEEAVEAAARALYDDTNVLGDPLPCFLIDGAPATYKEQAIEWAREVCAHLSRVSLSAALPHMTAAKDAETSKIDRKSAIWWKGYAEGKQDVIDRLNAISSNLATENERLRKALTDIITRSETGTLGASKVVDMRHIACAALGDVT